MMKHDEHLDQLMLSNSIYPVTHLLRQLNASSCFVKFCCKRCMPRPMSEQSFPAFGSLEPRRLQRVLPWGSERGWLH